MPDAVFDYEAGDRVRIRGTNTIGTVRGRAVLGDSTVRYTVENSSFVALCRDHDLELEEDGRDARLSELGKLVAEMRTLTEEMFKLIKEEGRA